MTTPKEAFELVKSGQWTGHDFDAWLAKFHEDAYEAGFGAGYSEGYDNGESDTLEGGV